MTRFTRLTRRHIEGARPSKRWVLAQTCLALALLVFLAASAGMVAYLLSLGRDRSLDPESVIGIVFLWPLVIVLAGGLGSVGLLAARRPRAIWVLLAASIPVVIAPLDLALDGANRLGSHIPNTITVVTQGPGGLPITHTITQGGSVATGAGFIPFTGGAVVAIIALFAGLNGAALYGGWRVMRLANADADLLALRDAVLAAASGAAEGHDNEDETEPPDPS